MEENIYFIFSNPLKQKHYGEDIIVFPEARFVAVKQKKGEIDYIKLIKKNYKFKNYELNQDNLWKLVEDIEITLLDVGFTLSVGHEDKTELIDNVRNKKDIYLLKKYLEKETEIDFVYFLYKKISIKLNRFGVLSFAAEESKTKEYILSSPLLRVLGIKARGKVS